MRKNEILLVAESDNRGYPSSYLESLFTQSLSVLAARCLCEILKAHPHFNYRNNIIKVLVPYMNRGNKEVALKGFTSVCFINVNATGHLFYNILETLSCVGREMSQEQYKHMLFNIHAWRKENAGIVAGFSTIKLCI